MRENPLPIVDVIIGLSLIPIAVEVVRPRRAVASAPADNRDPSPGP